MQITDRAKDVIKSGGEWISSIDLENAAMSHPAVRDGRGASGAASQVGRTSAAGRREDARRELTRDELIGFSKQGRQVVVARRVEFVDALPLGATGKVQKLALREKFGRL